MICKFCGFENGQDFSYCPNCGAPAHMDEAPIPVSPVPVNVAAKKILPALKDTLFLVLCILMSISCGATLISTGPDVLSILFTIFLWLVYAQARKGIADATHLRQVSGTVYAHYVIINVCAILLIVLGGILGLCFSAMVNNAAFMSELVTELELELELGMYDTQALMQLLPSVSGTLIFVIFVSVGALMLVINIFSIRYIHRFAKSVYKSVESGTLELKHANATYVWLIVFAVCSGLGLLEVLGSGDVMAIVSNGASCAMPILAAILIKKYLLTAE